MSRVWFAQPLETAATFWRILRRDGIALGFTTHDHDLWFDGVLHSATPGMIPSSIRRSAGFEADSAEVEGALSHDSISEDDLAAGRFDGARVLIGLADWESGEHEVLYRGEIGSVLEESGKFTAELRSRKAELKRDPIPRTSPSCRALFCGPGCSLSAPKFSYEGVVTGANVTTNVVSFTTLTAPAWLIGGTVRWFDGPHAGTTMTVLSASAGGLVVDAPISAALAAGQRALLREGCDHTLETCATRFGNAVNFQGEPFLPGNDLVFRYPPPPQ